MTVKIKSEDYILEVTLDDRVKRLLIREFLPFIKGEITARGYNVDDPALFDQDQIEAAVWGIVDNAIQEVEQQVNDRLNDIEMTDEELRELLQETLDRVSTEKVQEYLDDQLGGIETLIMLASGNFPEFA